MPAPAAQACGAPVVYHRRRPEHTVLYRLVQTHLATWLALHEDEQGGHTPTLALMFLAKERLAHRDTASLLSCNDLVEIMRHKLPCKIESDDDLVAALEDRHRRRRIAMNHAYQKQALMLGSSLCGGI